MKYGEAIKLPVQDLRKLLIGIVISIIPIVNFISMGYFLESAKSAMKGKYKMPEWKNFWQLFKKGFVATIIGIIYAIPALILLLLFILSLFKPNYASLVAGQQSFQFFTSMLVNINFGLLALLIIFFLAAMYLSPMAIMNYVKFGKFEAAFSLRRIIKRAFTGTYFAAWLLGGIYFFILVIILSVLFFFLPFIGSGIATFVGGMTYYSLIGEAYGKIKIK